MKAKPIPPQCYCNTVKGARCRNRPTVVCEHGSYYCPVHLKLARKRGMRCPTKPIAPPTEWDQLAYLEFQAPGGGLTRLPITSAKLSFP